MAEQIYGFDKDSAHEIANLVRRERRLPDTGRRTRRRWPTGGGEISINFTISSVGPPIKGTVTWITCGNGNAPGEDAGDVTLINPCDYVIEIGMCGTATYRQPYGGGDCEFVIDNIVCPV